VPALHLQELFETPYFCQEQKQEYYRLAQVVPSYSAAQPLVAILCHMLCTVPFPMKCAAPCSPWKATCLSSALRSWQQSSTWSCQVSGAGVSRLQQVGYAPMKTLGWQTVRGLPLQPALLASAVCIAHLLLA
jgi:hypothetical protein